MKKVLSVRNNRIYLYTVMVYMVLSVFIYWDRTLDIMNTTVFAFSYQYGFMPRGVLGTVLWLYDAIVPFDAISYNTIYFISKIATAVYFIMILWFIVAVMSRCNEKHLTSAKGIMAVLVLISVPMFLTADDFGRLDVYLMILTIFSLILIIYEKAEWLIIPAVTLATLIHEGFVFMNINIILVLLLYKCITKPDKRKKYIIILAFTFIIPSIVFLYCEFFSHNFGMDVFNECLDVATKVSKDNMPHKEVLLHEILGINVADMEIQYRIWNFEDTPIFLVLFSPYIAFMVYAFRKYAKTATEKPATTRADNSTVPTTTDKPAVSVGVEKFITFIILVGPLTLLPEIVLKVDYGRYVFSILFYYLAIFTVLVAIRDARMEQTVAAIKVAILRHKLIAIVGFLALFIFTPIRGFRICDVVTALAELIFGKMG